MRGDLPKGPWSRKAAFNPDVPEGADLLQAGPWKSPQSFPIWRQIRPADDEALPTPQFYPPREWGGPIPIPAPAQMGGGYFNPGVRIRWLRKKPDDLGIFWENRQTKPFWASETPRIGLATRILYRKDRRSAHMQAQGEKVFNYRRSFSYLGTLKSVSLLEQLL